MEYIKLSDDLEGTYKDKDTGQVVTIKEIKSFIQDQKKAFDYFKKVEITQGMKKDVEAAINYYNENYIEMGLRAANHNIDKCKFQLQEISKIDPKVADILYGIN